MSDSIFFSPEIYALFPLLLKITILFCLTWITVLYCHRSNPYWRLILLRGAVIGILAMPVLTAVVPSINVPLLQDQSVQSPSPVQYPVEKALPSYTPILSQSDSIPIRPSTSIEPIVNKTKPSPSAGRNPILTLGVIWIFGILTLCGYAWIHHRKIKQMIEDSKAAPANLKEQLKQTAERMGVLKTIDLRYSPKAAAPFLYGGSHPTIVLPELAIGGDFSDDLPTIFAHELSHVQSNDLAWMAVFRVMQTLFWFHPLSWALIMTHKSVCEEYCDMRAAQFIGSRDVYSQTLARVTLHLLTQPPAYAGLGMARLPEIRRRLNRLKRPINTVPVSQNRILSFLVIGGIALTGFAGLQIVHSEQNNPQNLDKETSMSSKILHDIQWYIDPNATQKGEPSIYHSFVASLATAMNYIDEDFDPVKLMGSSGFAFRTFVCKDLCPSAMSMFSFNDILPESMEQTGYQSIYIHRMWDEKRLEKKRREQAHDAIVNGIDRGVPAIVWDTANVEWGLIIGYDMKQERYETLTDEGKRSTLAFNRLGRNGIDILSVTIPGQRNERTEEEITLNALKTAVAHAEQKEWFDRPNYQNGLAGLDLWASIYDKWAPNAEASKRIPVYKDYVRFSAYYTGHTYSARCYARDYLKSIANGDPNLEKAALSYEKTAASLKPVWELFSNGKELSEEALTAAAQNIRSAKINEEHGIGFIKEYLAQANKSDLF